MTMLITVGLTISFGIACIFVGYCWGVQDGWQLCYRSRK